MATAPAPGAGKRAEAIESARRLMTITVRGHDPVTIAPGNVPFKERLLVRKATGLPYDAFMGDGDRIGLDSVQVLWWLGRRAAGEVLLTLNHALADFELLGDLDELDEDAVQVDISDWTGDASDPEV